ncbi:oligosaccharide flippase family protein [Peribacillus sp. NPDC097675]|uniref:oligosaccharide flippase family protein n=1 Tax=Peribacillus sp. NPDC097675 TaxID=3390618 RepID=UPI003CFE675F
MKNQLKAGASLSYVALFINILISIIYTPVMLNILGQSEYGLYSLASSAAGYIGILNFGLGNAVIRYTAKYRTLNDEEGCSNLYGLFLKIYLTLGFLALIAGSLLTLNVDSIFSSSINVNDIHKLKLLMGIMVLNISTGIGLGLFSVIVLAHEKFIFQKMIVIVSSLVNPILILPLLYMGYGSIAMAIITTLLNVLFIALNIYYCFKRLKIKISFGKFEPKLFKEIIIFSSYIFLNLIISQLYTSTDQVILGIFSGTVAISVYAIGASFTGYFSGFSSAISNVFLTRVSGMVIKEVTNKELSDLFIKIGRIQYIIISFALSGFIVFGQEFINLWVGKEYADSYIIALIILIPMVVSLIQGMGGVILQAKNMQGFKSIVNIFIAMANVVISIIFVKIWGVIGCAIATAISFTIGNIIIINIFYWKKIKLNIPNFWVNITFMSIPLIVSVIYGNTLNKLLIADLWMVLIGKISVFSIIYILAMWFTGMNKYEKNLFIIPAKNYYQKFRVRVKNHIT